MWGDIGLVRIAEADNPHYKNFLKFTGRLKYITGYYEISLRTPPIRCFQNLKILRIWVLQSVAVNSEELCPTTDSVLNSPTLF